MRKAFITGAIALVAVVVFSSVAVAACTNPMLALIGLEAQKMAQEIHCVSTLGYIERHRIAGYLMIDTVLILPRQY